MLPVFDVLAPHLFGIQGKNFSAKTSLELVFSCLSACPAGIFLA
jgi:hypothetical protein